MGAQSIVSCCPIGRQNLIIRSNSVAIDIYYRYFKYIYKDKNKISFMGKIINKNIYIIFIDI
jgi:hypothetical protein